MEFLIRLFICALVVFASAHFLSGVRVKNFFTAILTALAISLVNVIIKPIFIFLTIPLTILTLGLFLFVINALLIQLVNKIVSGFEVKNFWWALLFSIVLSTINTFLVKIF